ncbi:MAG: prepilin-type N-terminal cleavage/methylation domain-containing protein [Phycisphaerales bacterium]|nr:prepilin-type N-terminal cleavage/methylation domain-containing protein [Phycisphaerales bacterium]
MKYDDKILINDRVRSGFTLIELLVVVAVILIVLGIGAPTIKSMMRGNGQVQAQNAIRAYLATARSIAISQHRPAGVIFFEESTTYLPHGKPRYGQTAMQLIVEDPDQTTTTHTNLTPGNTVFIYHSRDREYLPAEISVAVLNDSSTRQVTSETIMGTSNARIILFDANGQLVLRNGVMRPREGNAPGQNDDIYPYAYGDWIRSTTGSVGRPDGVNSQGVSSPAILIYNGRAFRDGTKTSDTDEKKSDWILQNADILVINPYTGSLIR